MFARAEREEIVKITLRDNRTLLVFCNDNVSYLEELNKLIAKSRGLNEGKIQAYENATAPSRAEAQERFVLIQTAVETAINKRVDL